MSNCLCGGFIVDDVQFSFQNTYFIFYKKSVLALILWQNAIDEKKNFNTHYELKLSIAILRSYNFYISLYIVTI